MKALATWQKCTICKIAKYRTRVVVGEGVLPCDVLICGEGPGRGEDVLGRPFVGAAGRLLRSILPPNLTYYITNLVACRPCDSRAGSNRPPSGLEIENCRPRLDYICLIAKPKVAIVLGKVAADNALHSFKCLGSNTPIYFLWHPAYLLRNGATVDKPLKKQPKAYRLWHSEMVRAFHRAEGEKK